MWEPPWKSLVKDLKERGYESEYLERLTSRLDVAEHARSLERQIVEEMAYALARAEDKVNVALLQLEMVARELDGASSPTIRAAGVAEYNRRREDAIRARWELKIHREALGLVYHADVDEHYPIPPRLER